MGRRGATGRAAGSLRLEPAGPSVKVLDAAELSVVVAALLCALGAVGARRQGWTVVACGLGTLALVGEAWRRGPDQRLWVLWAAPLLIGAGEVVRLAVDARRRGTRVTVESATYRQVAVGVGLVLFVVVVTAGAVLALPSSAEVGSGQAGNSAVPVWLLPAGVVVLGVGVEATAIGLGRLARYRQAARRSGLVVVVAVAFLVGGALVVGAAGLVRIESEPSAVVQSPGVGSGSGQAEPTGLADDGPSRARPVIRAVAGSLRPSPLATKSSTVLPTSAWFSSKEIASCRSTSR